MRNLSAWVSVQCKIFQIFYRVNQSSINERQRLCKTLWLEWEDATFHAKITDNYYLRLLDAVVSTLFKLRVLSTIICIWGHGTIKFYTLDYRPTIDDSDPCSYYENWFDIIYRKSKFYWNYEKICSRPLNTLTAYYCKFRVVIGHLFERQCIFEIIKIHYVR